MPQLSLLHVVDGKVRTDLRCAACDLCSSPELKTNRMGGTGNSTPTYMIVGKHPGVEDDRRGYPMAGGNGRLLRELLQTAGVDVRSCYVTNVIKCCPHGKNVLKRHVQQCQDYLVEEIRHRRPKVILAAGAEALTWLTGQTGLKKLRRRGLPCALDVGYSVLVFPIRQPAMLFHTEDRAGHQTLYQSMVEDLRWIRGQVEAGTIQRGGDIPTNYQVARTEADCDRFFAEFAQHDYLACDLETGDTNFRPRLFPYDDCRVIAVGFSFGPGIGRAIPLFARGLNTLHYWPDRFVEDNLVPRIAELLRTKEVFGHNFVAFDQKWVRHQFDVDYCRITFDTMLAHYLLDEEKGTHDLEQLALLFTTMAPWKSTFCIPDTNRLCEYLCRDVDATWRLREVFEGQLNELQWWRLRELLLPAGNVLMDMEYRGVPIHRENLKRLETYLTERIEKIRRQLGTFDAVKAWSLAQGKEFNPLSDPQVRNLMEHVLKLPRLKTTAGGEYSVDAEVMDTYSDEPCVSEIVTLRALQKLASKEVRGLIAASEADGRAHTSYKLHGTVTGRPTSESLNLNNITSPEKAGKVLEDGAQIKGLFTAEDGHVLLEADYSQIELRVLACLSGDKEMLRIFRVGEDMHAATAAAACGVPLAEVTPVQRRNAKAINFGVIYGMGENTLIKRFIAAGNTEEEALGFYANHRKTFPDMWAWIAEQERILRTRGFQETHFGMRRRYAEITAEAIRQGYNFPIQSTASDFTLLSLPRVVYVFKRLQISARPVLTVYDSIISSMPKDRFWDAAEAVKVVMEGLAFDWLTVPLVVDLKAGLTWGAMKDVDLKTRSIG